MVDKKFRLWKEKGWWVLRIEGNADIYTSKSKEGLIRLLKKIKNEIKFDKKIEELYKQKTQLIKDIAIIDVEISNYIKNCKHKIIKRGSIVSIAVCKKCGKHFGWYCEENKKHYCEYDDIKDPIHDNCIHCHQPEERK